MSDDKPAEDGRTVAEVLKGIPGADARIELAREEIEQGRGTPLEEL